MKAEDVTRESLSKALRVMRQSAGLTQVSLAKRSAKWSPPLRRVLPSQVSDFEHGRSLPHFPTLVSLVVACSADGATVDFTRLQNALGPIPVDQPPGESLAGLRSEMADLRSEMADLRSGLRSVVKAIGPRQEVQRRDVLAERSHVTQAQLAAFVAGEVHLVAEDQLRLAVHLAAGCERCWTALEVSAAAPDLEDLGRELAAAPLLRALRRVRSPRSWPVLTSEHLEAARRVRERTWGFARLLIEEADVLIDEIDETDEIDKSSTTYDLERLLELPGKVVEALTRCEPECRIGADLKARLELVRAHGLSYERPEAIPAALERAGWYLRQGTGSKALWIELLLAQARQAFYEGGGDPSGRIRRGLAQCFELLEPEDHLRRLEVTLTAAKYEELDAFWRTADTRHLRWALVRCQRQWRDLRLDPDPNRRLSGLLRFAELGWVVRLVAEMRLGERAQGIPALAALAGTLEAQLAELEGHAEGSLVQRIRRVIACLRVRRSAAGQPSGPKDPPGFTSAKASGGSLFRLSRRASS